MLAAEANYSSGEAIVGTKPGSELAIDEVLAALQAIGYRGKVGTRQIE